MAQTRIASAIFIVLVSVNVIQAVLPQFFHEDTFPDYVKLVDAAKLGELSHGAASSAASAASDTFTGFKTYIDNFRTRLGQYVPPKFQTALHRNIWPSQRVGVVPSQLAAPGLYGNYGGYGGYGGVRDSDAASAAAASAAASEGLPKRRVVAV